MGTFDEIRAASQDFRSETSRAQIQAQLSKILTSEPNDALTLAFCGIFNSGKSSLINELLQQEFKLPCGAVPVTKFVTRLKYGKIFAAYYVWHGEEHPLERSDLEKILTGKLPLPDESLEVRIYLPAKILRGGVEILDTPGFLDSQELTDFTRAAVAEADIAMFCCNATAAGKEFELDYFKELEEIIGNFCVIVTHIDLINSDEDFERIKNFMEGSVAGRGRAILHFLDMEKIFYTAAGGQCISIAEFKKFFLLLCRSLSKKFRRRIQRYSYQKRTIHALQMLLDEINAQIQCGELFYSYAENAAEDEYQNARKIYLDECRRISERLKEISDSGQKSIAEAISDIEREFDFLESQNCAADFQSKANNYLRDKLLNIPAAIQTKLKKFFPGQDFDAKNFFADYIAVVKNYSVPEPVGKLVDNQSTIKKALGAIVSVLTPITIFGSYDTVYENYALAARQNLRDKLSERLQEKMRTAFNLIEAALKPPPSVKNDTLSKEIAICRQEWEVLETEVSKYLTFCRQKFVWGTGIDRKIFLHAV